MKKSKIIKVKGKDITVLKQGHDHYISLTDMLRAKDGVFFISDWLRNVSTVMFLGVWESVNNPDFNYGEFATIKSQAGLHSYKISVKAWVAWTRAIGLKATAGRYGGTYAQSDIISIPTPLKKISYQKNLPKTKQILFMPVKPIC